MFDRPPLRRLLFAGLLALAACGPVSENPFPLTAPTMRSAHLLAKLQNLGISASFSRPRTSNDNPYSEALFRTLKYRPSYLQAHCEP